MSKGTSQDKPVWISRTAKGERPQNFSDPAIDKLVGMILSLASELSVVRDRLDTVERLIEQRDLLPRSAIEDYEPSATERAERAARRAEYLDRVLQSARRDLDESQSGRVARPLEQIVSDYAAKKI